MVSFFIFVIGNGSLLYLIIRIRSCREIHQRRISGRWLDWWRPRNWRTWSRWFSRVVQSPDSSHGSSDPSDRRPGSSFWSPRRRVWPPGCCVISRNRHCWLCSRAGLGIWSHTLVHPSLQQSPHGHKINQYSLIDRSWYWREKRTADPRQDGGVLSTRWHSPCWGSMGCRAVQYHRLMACWAVRIRRVIKLECWAVRWCLLAWRVVTSCWPVTYGPVNCRAVCWAVTGQVIPCWVVTGWAVNCWAFHHLWRTRHCCWAGDFNCRFFYLNWLGRRRDHCDSSPLWGLGNVLETTVLHVWRRTMVRSFQHSLIFSHDDDWAETFGWPMPEMTMITGICNRLKTCNDGEHERKRPKDGCPSPWKRGWTLNYQSHPLVSWSWTHPKSLDGTAQPLFVCCHVSNMVSGGVLASVGPVSSLPIPTPQSVAFRPIRGGPSHHRDAWSHGLWFTGPRRPGGRFLYLRCPRPRTSGSLCPFRPVAAGTLGRKLKNFFRSMDFDRIVHGLTFLGFLCRSRGLAPFLLFIGLGLCLPSLKQPIFTDIAWLVFCQPFAQSTLLAAKVVAVSSEKVPATWELQLGISGRWRAMWSHIRHLVHTGMAWHEDENKLDFVPQATWPNV